MNKPTPDSQAEALYQYLRGHTPEQDTDLPAEEASLAAELKSAAQEIHADPQFQASLEARLMQTQQAKKSDLGVKFLHFGRGIAWAGLAIILVLVVAWSISNLLPGPVKQLAQPVVPSSPTANQKPAVETQSTGLSLPTTSPTPELPLPIVDSSMFPRTGLVLNVNFPITLTQVPIYTQLSSEALTVDNAQSVAAKLGIQGPVYTTPGDIRGHTNYFVTDGISRVVFFNSPQYFHYTADMIHVQPESLELPSIPEQISKAEAFLNSHGLLDFPYQVETTTRQPGVIHFVRLLGGREVRYSMLSAPWIEVQIGPQGQVMSVDYNVPGFQDIGNYSIISAQQAWQKVISKEPVGGIGTSSESVSPYNIRSWQHEYPLNQRVELFGYLEVDQPAQPGGTPFIAFNNYPVTNAPNELTQSAQPGQFIQVWGQFQTGTNGKSAFQIEGWQASAFPDQPLEGTILRRGDKAVLVTTDRTLILPDLPANITEGSQANVRGVVVEQAEPALEWSEITIGGSGGGGGGGGTSFAELNLNPSSVTAMPATATPMPAVQTGQHLEGIRGVAYVVIHQYSNGSSSDEITFNVGATDGFPQGLSLRLEGPNLKDIQRYHMLPIRVWGTISSNNATMPTLKIERVEPVYPGLSAQAWLGTSESITLDGKQVLRFTAQDGTQYILESSIKQTPESMGVIPGEPLLVEGAAYPDQTFAGLPVITDFADISSPGIDNLNGYQPKTIVPSVIREQSSSPSQARYIIDKIELVYLTDDLRYGAPTSDSTISYAQPVWRFTGLDENGNPFEIMVQALKPEYLK